MAERSTKNNPAASLVKRMTPLLEPELAAPLSRVANDLLTDADFQRGLTKYRRIESYLRDENKTAPSWEGQLHSDFKLFASAHILRLAGANVGAIVEQLGDDRVASWLKLHQIPAVIFAHDPERWEHAVKHVDIPRSESTDLAYVLGAFAGHRRPGPSSRRIGFWSGERELIERVVEAAAVSCGLGLRCSQAASRAEPRFFASTVVSEFVNYLQQASNGNTRVPWEHLQTKQERREFLRGFFDFSGGTVSVHFRRIVIGRRNNTALLEEVAVLLKREGIFGRVSTGSIPSLHLESYQTLEALERGGLVTARRLRDPIRAALARPAEVHGGRVEDYEAVMSAARRLKGQPRIMPRAVLDVLKRDGSPAADLAPDTVRDWVIDGRVPASVVRLRTLEALEARVLSSSRLAGIGEKIVERLGGDLHPARVVRAIGEFLGGNGALARVSGVPEREIEALKTPSRLPTRAEYRLILGTVGLELAGLLERASQPPNSHEVDGWMKGSRDVETFRSYQAAIMIVVRAAFEKGEDAKKAAFERLARLQKRSSPRLNDDFS